MSGTIDLIAETDEIGRIAWVWRRGPNDRHARPIAEPSRHLDELGHSKCHGATPLAISDWFDQHVRAR